MIVVKNVHNNISICLDSKGNEVIAFGKGIGFKKPPYDVPISQIERTFYDINPAFVDRLFEIPENIIEVSTQIIDYACDKLGVNYDSNIIFTLADHINFAIKRYQEHITLDLPHLHDVKYMYPDEIVIGEYALMLIKERLNVELPREESAVITLHVIDYGLAGMQQAKSKEKNKIEECCKLVEVYFNVTLDKDSFSYFRFVSHMYYLLDRVRKDEKVESKNGLIFKKLVEEYPQANECAQQINKELELNLTDEEVLYLIIHINRLISREDK